MQIAPHPETDPALLEEQVKANLPLAEMTNTPRPSALHSRKRSRTPEGRERSRDRSDVPQAINRMRRQERIAGEEEPVKKRAKTDVSAPVSNTNKRPRQEGDDSAVTRIVESTKRTKGRPEKRQKQGRLNSSQAQSVFSRRDSPPPKQPRSPSPIRRSSTPPRASPSRQRKRPGGASRIGNIEKEAVRQRQEDREREQLALAQQTAAIRGVHDVVRQHYNAVPERGRDWRKTDSRIKGLRIFNNWIKSTIIQKFSPNENFTPEGANITHRGLDEGQSGLLVLDIGCGKGGDLGKWQQAPQSVELYVGADPAEISIEQARERYSQMRGRGGGRGGSGGFRGGRPQQSFQGEFFVKDCYGEWLGDIPLIRDVGIDGSVGPGGSSIGSRWGGGGFDVVSMMFCMHYAFENEAKARGMLRNVAGSLKKGGRFLGVIPNSDVLRSGVEDFHKHQVSQQKPNNGERTSENGVHEEEDGKAEDFKVAEWGNSIYRVRFPGKTPEDGVFRPPFGWKYSYFMEEAVEEVPEYVVPWEAFRA